MAFGSRATRAAPPFRFYAYLRSFMQHVLADFSVSISELKKNPSALLAQACGSAIAVLDHNKPAAYLVPAETYEALMDALEDLELAKLVEERQGQKDKAVSVSLDDI